MRSMFIIDCVYNPLGEEETTHKSNGKHLTYPLFNNKKRVRKLFEKTDKSMTDKIIPNT